MPYYVAFILISRGNYLVVLQPRRARGICREFDPRLGLVADERLQHLATLPIVQHTLRRIGNYFQDVAYAWQHVELDAIRRSDAQIDH